MVRIRHSIRSRRSHYSHRGCSPSTWGPVVGGLFLAFPAIFPAAATLIATHEREKKQAKGLRGQRRGIVAAAVESEGAVMGSVGLPFSLCSAGKSCLDIVPSSYFSPLHSPGWRQALRPGTQSDTFGSGESRTGLKQHSGDAG